MKSWCRGQAKGLFKKGSILGTQNDEKFVKKTWKNVSEIALLFE